MIEFPISLRNPLSGEQIKTEVSRPLARTAERNFPQLVDPTGLLAQSDKPLSESIREYNLAFCFAKIISNLADLVTIAKLIGPNHKPQI